MRIFRLIVGAMVLLVVLTAGYLVLRSQGILGRMRMGDVRAVPAGHQEIALIAPATSDEAWERLVAAARYLVREWKRIDPSSPPLQVSLDQAFLNQTAGVPEFGLYFEGREQATLWVRWYKLSSDMDSRAWVERLGERQPAPLAILGGDTSDRAVTLGRALAARGDGWSGKPPLFLISTATADQLYPGDHEPRNAAPKLVEVYGDRSFRFSFTNSRMAEAVMEFLQLNREAWLSVSWEPAFFAGLVGEGSSLGIAAGMAAGGHLQSPVLYTLAWTDDRYSLDLADRLRDVFVETFYPGRREMARLDNSLVHYGVGDFSIANPREIHAAGMFLAHSGQFKNRPQILALPTGSQKARRFLRCLYGMAPREFRNLVVVNGDSLTFNHIYRDRNVAWNIVEVPAPLVFFSHRTPVDREAGFGQKVNVGGEERIATTGTQDLLLNADILSAAVQAAFQQDGLTDDVNLMKDSLREMRWHDGKVVHPRGLASPRDGAALFDAEGNRRHFTGERVVWLRPYYSGDEVQMRATISVWGVRPGPGASHAWIQAGQSLEVDYNGVPQGNLAHEPD